MHTLHFSRNAALACLLILLAAAPATAQTVAYVSTTAAGSGTLGDPADPFPTLNAALTVGADELRIEPGTYAENLNFSALDLTFRLWNGQTGGSEVLDGGGAVTLQGGLTLIGATLTLAGGGATYTVTGNLDLDGTLDIVENTLAINAQSGNTILIVRAAGNLTASDVPGKAASHVGLLKFLGEDDTSVFIETTSGRLRFDFPAIECDKPGNVSFDANGLTGTNQIDALGTPSFTQRGTGDVELLDGLDLLDIFVDYEQLDGEFLMVGVSSISTQQRVSTGGNTTIHCGTFDANGGHVNVLGDYQLGDNPATCDALFSLDFNGIQTVVGDFTVNEGAQQRQGFGNTFVGGDFFFFGEGDGAGSGNTGVFGDFFFTGAGEEPQNFLQRQHPDALLDDVILQTDRAILGSDVTTNEFGILLLEMGIIDTADEPFDWIILNPAIEPDLVGRNNSAAGKGVVQLGSRDSYINSGVQRTVERGNATGGLITGGYLFPVGAAGDERKGESGDVDFFRPLILQFPDDLGRSSLARVDYREDLLAENVDFDPVVVDDDGGTLLLDVISDQFWQLEFDRIPSFDPNVRVVADGLPNVFDIKKLRLIQWDCDGTNPRPAGFSDDDNPDSAMRTAIIDGVPNISHKSVEVSTCTIIGIASNFATNPINDPPPAADFAVTVVTPDEVRISQTFVVTATVDNFGPDAGPATLFFEPPSTAPIQSATRSDGGSCNPSGHEYFCVINNLDADTQLEIGFDLLPQTTGVVTGTFNLSSSDDPNTDNNTASFSVEVLPPPVSNFSVQVQVNAEEVQIGQTLTITNTVDNLGPDAGPADLLLSYTPGALISSFTRSDGGTCFQDFNKLACTADNLDAQAQLDLYVDLIPQQTGVFTATYAVSSSQDMETANNTASISVDVLPAPATQARFLQFASDAPVQVFVDGVEVTEGLPFDYGTATPYGEVPTGGFSLLVQNGLPDLITTVPLNESDPADVFLRQEGGVFLAPDVVDPVRMEADTPGTADVYFFNATDGTTLRLEEFSLDPEHELLQEFTNDLPPGGNTPYFSLPPGPHNLGVSDTFTDGPPEVFLVELNADMAYTITIAPGEGGGKRAAFTLFAFDAASTRTDPPVVTAFEPAGDVLPEAFALFENYPNPFNPATTIRYALADAVTVQLDVFDTLGRRVRTLVAAEQTAGTYTVRWDARNEAGTAVGSGVYLYRLKAGSFVQTRAMLLLK